MHSLREFERSSCAVSSQTQGCGLDTHTHMGPILSCTHGFAPQVWPSGNRGETHAMTCGPFPGEQAVIPQAPTHHPLAHCWTASQSEPRARAAVSVPALTPYAAHSPATHEFERQSPLAEHGEKFGDGAGAHAVPMQKPLWHWEAAWHVMPT